MFVFAAFLNEVKRKFGKSNFGILKDISHELYKFTYLNQ